MPALLQQARSPILLHLLLPLLLILLGVPMHPATTSLRFCQAQDVGKEDAPIGDSSLAAGATSSSRAHTQLQNILYIIADDLTAPQTRKPQLSSFADVSWSRRTRASSHGPAALFARGRPRSASG
jgi:hypothetical protein